MRMRNRKAKVAESLANIKRQLEERMWWEYDEAAKYLARQGVKGPLPNFISDGTATLINADPEAFYDRVKAFSYALSMEKIP